MLDGREPFGQRQQGGAGLLLLNVIAFGDTKVDQSGIPLFVDQDITGFHVEVKNALLMHELQCLANLSDVADRLLLRKHTLFSQQRFQRIAVDVLHGDIGRVVLLEYLQDVDDVGMVHFGEDTCLFDQFLLELVEKLFASRRVHANR